MRSLIVLLLLLLAAPALAADPAPRAPRDSPSKTEPAPKTKIEPGKIIVPTDNMRRIWGELVSIDLVKREGVFRNESNDQLQTFVVMPYAELLHHAALGDLQDFRVGERAIFRVHPDDADRWIWLTYIQDEMNFLDNHKEYYWVDRIDAADGKLECTDANADKSFVRQQGIMLETDAETRYWKDAEPAKFADIRVGDRLRTQTHGLGQGAPARSRRRVANERVARGKA